MKRKNVNDDWTTGEDLRPHYDLFKKVKVVSEEILIDNSDPDEEKMILKRRLRCINEKPQFFHTVQMIDIDKIGDRFEDWNLFEKPTTMEQLDLERSIDNVGLLNPIYVLLMKDGSYNVLIGRCRLIAYCNLFLSTNLQKYRFIPCYVIPYEDVDELYIRSMMIESNICYRKISKYNMITALITNYEIMKNVKSYRNEINIGMELAKQFDISESTVFNFLKIKNLCDPGLTLLYNDEITLQVATYLTKVPKETQVNILKTCGVKGANKIFKLKLLTNEEEEMTIEKIKAKLKNIDKASPIKTQVSVEIHKTLFNPLIEHLLQFKRNEATKFSGGYCKGNFNGVFRAKFKNEDIELYREKDMVNEITMKKLLAKNISEMCEIK